MGWRSRLRTVRRVGPLQVLLARMWISMNGDERARRGLQLRADPIVVDVGAYKGDFAEVLRKDWNAHVVAIEPIPEFASALFDRFREDENVTVIPVALGKYNGRLSITLSEDGSSAWGSGGQVIDVPSVDASEVIGNMDVALLKINAEGAEYDVLERLVETKQMFQIDSILIQFHRFVPDSRRRRRAIRRLLRESHRCAWSVPWVWEKWVAKR